MLLPNRGPVPLPQSGPPHNTPAGAAQAVLYLQWPAAAAALAPARRWRADLALYTPEPFTWLLLPAAAAAALGGGDGGAVAGVARWTADCTIQPSLATLLSPARSAPRPPSLVHHETSTAPNALHSVPSAKYGNLLTQYGNLFTQYGNSRVCKPYRASVQGRGCAGTMRSLLRLQSATLGAG